MAGVGLIESITNICYYFFQEVLGKNVMRYQKLGGGGGGGLPKRKKNHHFS